jgi:enamine deaminase RidA (YjgF/YER057c/UK114 family)
MVRPRNNRPAARRVCREKEHRVPVHRFQNPPTIHAPRGYSHVVETSGPSRTVYIAGQVGMAPDGKIAPDFRAQVTQCFDNLKAALAAAGAGFEHVVKTTNYFVDIGQLPAFREIRDRYFDTKAPPASTAVQVAKLAAPEFLFEIEAIAVVPQK